MRTGGFRCLTGGWGPDMVGFMLRAMRVDRLLGEHGIGQDSAAGRKEFERQMERRRLEALAEEALKPLRWGCYLGREQAITARRRSETTLPIKWIAARVQIGTAKGAKSVLHPSGSEPRPTQNRQSPRTMHPARIPIYGLTPRFVSLYQHPTPPDRPCCLPRRSRYRSTILRGRILGKCRRPLARFYHSSSREGGLARS